MQSGKKLVYDPSVGQFLDKKSAAKNCHGVAEDFHYVQFMKRERDAMQYKLNVLMKEQTEGEKHIVTNEEQEKEALKGSSVLAANLYKDCALCEMTYRPWNLPGKVPFKAVAAWKKNRGVPVPINDRRLQKSRLYEPVPLCLFCTQFFDKDFSDYVNYHLGTTEIRDKTLLLEDNTGRHNELDPSVTKKLQHYTNTGTLQTDFIRPGSAFIQEMEMDALRDKRYLPKLMR